MDDTKNNSDSALGHLRVIEVGDIPAAYATRWLADLGANVIKVEPPGGDPSRRLPPFAGNIEHPERKVDLHSTPIPTSAALFSTSNCESE